MGMWAFLPLLQQSWIGMSTERSDPNLNRGIPITIRNVNDTPSIFFFKKQKGSRGFKRTDCSPVVLGHIVIEKFDQRDAFNFLLEDYDTSCKSGGVVNKGRFSIQI